MGCSRRSERPHFGRPSSRPSTEATFSGLRRFEHSRFRPGCESVRTIAPDARPGRGAGAPRRPIGGRAAPASVKSSSDGLTAPIHATRRRGPTARIRPTQQREDPRASGANTAPLPRSGSVTLRPQVVHVERLGIDHPHARSRGNPTSPTRATSARSQRRLSWPEACGQPQGGTVDRTVAARGGLPLRRHARRLSCRPGARHGG